MLWLSFNCCAHVWAWIEETPTYSSFTLHSINRFHSIKPNALANWNEWNMIVMTITSSLLILFYSRETNWGHVNLFKFGLFAIPLISHYANFIFGVPLHNSWKRNELIVHMFIWQGFDGAPLLLKEEPEDGGPRSIQKVPSLSDLSDPEASSGM